MRIVFWVMVSFLSSLSILKAQSNQPGSIIHQNLQREYIMHLPTGYTGQEVLPLVVVLHGGSGSAQSAMGFTLMNSISNFEGFLVVYPQGVGPAQGGYAWADGRGTSADNLGVDDVGFITTLLDSLSISYPIDSNRVYLTGFSNGGFMSQRIACEMPEPFAAIASLGSTMSVDLFETCTPTKSIPMLFMNGTADPFIPYNGGIAVNMGEIVSTVDLVNFWQQQNGCSIELDSVNLPDLDPTEQSTITVFGFTDCNCTADVQLFRVNNGGHTWPGVENVNYEMIAGQTNEDIQASLEIWRFFELHERCEDVTNTIELDAKNNHWTIFPNPGKDFFSIHSISSRLPQTIRVFNLQGQLLLETNASIEEIIETPNLPLGIYLISISSKTGHMENHRWIKQ